MGASLTEEVLEYQRSRIGLHTLLDRIAVIVYRYPRGRFGWNEDDCSDFFCFFYPKLIRLVDRFQYQGKPFEVYLLTTLKWQLRTFAGQQTIRDLRVRVLTQQNFWAPDGQLEIHSETSLRGQPAEREKELDIPSDVRRVLKINRRNYIEDPSSRRRVLFLALKSAFRMTEPLLERLAMLTGYNLEWLCSLIEELKRRVRAQRERAVHLSERRNSCFFRIYCLQEQLRLAAEASVRSELTMQMLIEKDRLTAILNDLSHIPLSPTHRDIAEVLGIPKGTVDSGLYYLKESLRELSS